MNDQTSELGRPDRAKRGLNQMQLALASEPNCCIVEVVGGAWCSSRVRSLTLLEYDMSKKDKAPKIPKFFLTKKDYNPKVMHTKEAWEIVKKTIGVKGATQAELETALNMKDKDWAERSKTEGYTWKKQDHKCFIGYMKKLGNVVIKEV